MIKNYLKIAWRNVTKNKLYATINIFGLAVGMACCILIALYVQNEWSFDAFHSKSDRIYRSWTREDYGKGDIYFNTVTPVILKPTLEQDIPEVQQVARIYTFSNLVKHGSNGQATLETTTMVDASFFNIFDFSLTSGNKATVFEKPHSIVITPKIANRYFGDASPMQKTLSIKINGQYQDFVVAGIIKAPPVNSSIQYQMLIPFSNQNAFFGENARRSWTNVSPETYVLLNKGVNADQVEAKFPAMMKKALGNRYKKGQYTVGLQPLTDIHLDTHFPVGIAAVSSPVYSYLLGAIALLILIIACVNFMTLSVSRSTIRAREVGIRKTIGALRHQLMYQFWGEALMMTFFSVVFGLILAELLLPFFNQLSGTQLSLHYGGTMMLFLTGLAVLISFVAGIYPALVLSGFKPMEVLKGKLSLSADKSIFRQGMVVFQFSLSIILIACTLMVHKQLNYVRSADLGFNKKQIVVLQSGLSSPGPGTSISDVIQKALNRKQLLQSQISASPQVKDIAFSVFTPVQQGGWFNADFKDKNGLKHTFHFNIVDYDFIKTMGIHIVKGRDFSRKIASDRTRAIMVNKALVDDYGWKNPIGKHLPGRFIDHEIIGVVDNFHFQSLHTKVEPLAIAINPKILLSGIDNISFQSSAAPRYSVLLGKNEIAKGMDALKAGWKKIAPDLPFNFTFVDQAVDSQYRQEERLSKIVIFGSVLAVVIACLGLFGLASLMVSRRTKEIGVRKVLGASSSSIVLLVNKEFTKLVMIGFVLAVPVAWYGVQQWLHGFAYKVDMSWWLFLLAGLMALGMAWLTVSYQSVKATLVNPVDSLRSE